MNELISGESLYINAILASILLFSLFLIAERIYYVLLRNRGDRFKIFQNIENAVKDNHLSRVMNILTKNKKSDMSKVLSEAFGSIDLPIGEIHGRMNQKLDDVVFDLHKRLNVILLLSFLSLLVGISASIIGLIQNLIVLNGDVVHNISFSFLLNGLKFVIMSGIFSFLVSLPGFLFYFYLEYKINHIIDDVEYYSDQTLFLIQRNVVSRIVQSSENKIK